LSGRPTIKVEREILPYQWQECVDIGHGETPHEWRECNAKQASPGTDEATQTCKETRNKMTS